MKLYKSMGANKLHNHTGAPTDPDDTLEFVPASWPDHADIYISEPFGRRFRNRGCFTIDRAQAKTLAAAMLEWATTPTGQEPEFTPPSP